MIKRKDEIIDYLKALKYQHEANALMEIKLRGLEQYVQRENHKAALVQEIIEIVEKAP